MEFRTEEQPIVKLLDFGEDAKSKIFSGIEQLTKAVSSTLGASGKRVILENEFGKPVITKDGVTVANSVILLDPVENLGCTLLKEAARKTVREAGDGTTTATVLAHALIKAATSKGSVTLFDVKEINKATQEVIKYLEKTAIPVDDKFIIDVATISCNNDVELGKIIGDAFVSVGKDGVVLIEKSQDEKTIVELVDGVKLDRGFKSKHFITDIVKNKAELINPYILLLDSPIENIRKIQNVLEYVIDKKRPILIVGDLDQQPLSALIMNHLKSNIKVCVIDPPDFGINRRNSMEDIAVITGATVINEELGDDIDMITEEHLGSVTKVTVTEKMTILTVDEKRSEVDSYLKVVKKEIKEEKNSYKRQKLEERLAALSGKVAILKVGAHSEVELNEKYDRVDDSVNATKAAIKEGVLPGGGVALLNAAWNLPEGKSRGYEMIREAIQSPFKTILSNAGLESVGESDEGVGTDVRTGEKVDMVKHGIIDPLLVTKSALINAVSVATTILTTDCVISNRRI